MDYFNHLDSFPDALQNALKNELYADAMRHLLSLPDDAAKWETLGDISHKIDLADHALAYWRRADTPTAAAKALHHQNDQTWRFVGPELHDIDQLPQEGEYIILRLALPESGDRYHVRQSTLRFFFGSKFHYALKSSAFLDFFLQQEDSDCSIVKYDLQSGKHGRLKVEKRLREIKAGIVKKFPALADSLKPRRLSFSFEWKEKNFDERDENYLRQTLEVLSRRWYPFFYKSWSIEFQPLIFEMAQEGETTVYKAKLSQMVPFKEQDENAYRMYGVSEYVRGELEEGIWVEVREEKDKSREIVLRCKRSGMPKGVPTSRKLIKLKVKVVDEKTVKFGIGTGKNKKMIDHLLQTFGDSEVVQIY